MPPWFSTKLLWTRNGPAVFGRAFRSLHFAVRGRVVAKYTGQILALVALSTVVPAAVAGASGRLVVAGRYAVVIAVLGGAGALCARLRCTSKIQANEALVVTALAFVLPGLAMAFPIAGYGIPAVDALFESISGVTTTGLSTLGGIGERPAAFHFSRAWLQWMGGLGVVVLALAFLVPSGQASRRLGFEEREALDVVAGTRAKARRVSVVYVALTLAGWALCAATGMGAVDALDHALAAISTGGFAPRDESLAGQPGAARVAVSAVCLLGAISFFWYARFAGRRWPGALRDTQLWTLLALVAIGWVLLGLGSRSDRAEAWWHAGWMSVFAQTTAGFSTLDVRELAPFGQAVLIFQMLAGGHVGSTAGGLKVLRVVILWKAVVGPILRASVPPSAELRPRLDARPVGRSETEAAAALAVAMLGAVGVSWLLFLAFGHDPLAALFDVASAVGTVGLSAGTVGPDLEPSLKLVLCANMLLGRVEVFAFLVLLFPATWFGRRKDSR